MNKEFIVGMCSDLDFEGMVIDISYNIEAEILPRPKNLSYLL